MCSLDHRYAVGNRLQGLAAQLIDQTIFSLVIILFCMPGCICLHFIENCSLMNECTAFSCKDLVELTLHYIRSD